MWVGIEIGGTKLQFGLAQEASTLLRSQRWPVIAAHAAEGIRKQIVDELPRFLHQSSCTIGQVHGMGVGFGGPVDDHKQITIKSHQIAGWDAFPLQAWLKEQFGRPVAVANDSDVAGLAEAAFGAGKGHNPVFYMNVGSGIGGTLILNGQIHRGTGLGAGEIGHLWIDYDCDGALTNNHNRPWRVLEQCASGWSIADAYGAARAEVVIDRVKAGDPRAQHVLSLAIRRLALALSHVVALLCPRRIIVGGGLAEVGETLFLQPLRQSLHAIVFPPFRDAYDLVPAQLGESVVVHGALLYAQQQLT